MSSNVKNGTQEEYPKDSFDRFGDDLCGLAIMSSNVKNGTQEEYPKDSFDRFGDDLCGLVLSYLSLKDSFRYECLSKQWMRTVFIRRNTFSVYELWQKTKWLLEDYNKKINSNNYPLTITTKSLTINGHNSRDIDCKSGVKMMSKITKTTLKTTYN
ncbi:unnamed protein product, partial [Oppiella nova]